MKNNFFTHLKSDLPASLVVFLVAMPLCLGIALASGAPLFSGIIAGIVGGIVVALISGSPLGVSGPAAGLAVIVLHAIQDLGGFEVFLLAVVFAGLIQLILGFLKAGIIAYYFPSSVIKGMLTAIGIIIFLKQIPHAFGYDKNPEGPLAFSQVDGQNTFSELSNMLNYISPGALLISVLSLGILILWERPFMKKIPVFSIIQGPLVVVVLGILMQLGFANSEQFMIQADHLVSIPVAANIGEFFGQFSFPDFGSIGNPQVYVVAITMAIVASLETLLCVEATDKMDPDKRITPTNRELVAQGVGNMISGFIGGLPITQVIVRSSANIQSGGKSKASAFFHGILLLVSAIAIPNVLNMIPLASLAAILLVVGYKLAKPTLFKQMYKLGKAEFIPFMITVIGIVFTDLLVGIALGMVVAIFHILWNQYMMPYTINSDEIRTGEPIKIVLAENVSFLNKAGMMRTLAEMPEGSKVILDATKTQSIHPDVDEIITNFIGQSENRNIQVETLGWNELHNETPNPVKQFEKAIKDKKDQQTQAKF